VDGDELLLLAERTEEAEGVAAEADQRDCPQRDEAHRRGQHHPQARVAAPRRKQQKRQRQPGGQLHADSRHERNRARP
jgi:hypothetical protein